MGEVDWGRMLLQRLELLPVQKKLHQVLRSWAMNPQLGACREVWPLQSSKKPIGSTVLAPNNNDLTMQTSSCLGENHGAAGGGIEVASFPS